MSDKPVAERLQVKGSRQLAVVGAPAKADGLIGAREVRTEIGKADVVLLIAADRARLESELPRLLKAIPQSAILWVAYPKLTSTLAADLSRDVIHSLTPSYGLDTVSQIAIDDDWSAMRLKRVG
jgi:hypothetical protein